MRGRRSPSGLDGAGGAAARRSFDLGPGRAHALGHVEGKVIQILPLKHAHCAGDGIQALPRAVTAVTVLAPLGLELPSKAKRAEVPEAAVRVERVLNNAL
jgi:hypothetical protein